jgi:hypothetical protein
MKPWARWAILAGSAAALVILFVLLRPDDGTEAASPTPSTPAPTQSASPTVGDPPTPSASAEPERTVIDVAYRDGSVQGPSRFTATQGDRLRIVVRADVSDEVHLHGYDLKADVAPGDPARIDLVANAAGVFEGELEEAGTLLFRLEIVP